MSLCSQCGHNSVVHVAGKCFVDVWSRETCDCTLERWDPEFREGHDPHGSLLPGWPKKPEVH